MKVSRWFVKITTDKGCLELPLGIKGYKTKREAEQIAEMAKSVPGTVKVEVVKG